MRLTNADLGAWRRRWRRTVTFECGSHDGRVGLFVRFAENLEELVAGPWVANYPNCAVTNVEVEALPADFEIWSAGLTFVPDLFPILRHVPSRDHGRPRSKWTAFGELRCGADVAEDSCCPTRNWRPSGSRPRPPLPPSEMLFPDFHRLLQVALLPLESPASRNSGSETWLGLPAAAHQFAAAGSPSHVIFSQPHWILSQARSEP
jgi:hypothetical protein